MSSQPQLEIDLLSCNICLQILQNPKALACMHRYCESCLNGHILSNGTTTGSALGFSCPECREFIRAPSSWGIPSTWVAQIKTDFRIESLIELYQSRRGMNAPTVNNPCPQHEDKEQELYCFDCSETVCHLCVAISHRACHKINTLKEAAQERRATWQERVRQISVFLQEVEKTETLRENCMREVNQSQACVETEIRKTAENMRQTVTREEEKLLTQVRKSYADLHQNVVKFNEHVKQLKYFEKHLSSKLTSSSDFDVMLETVVADDVDSCMERNVVIKCDYTRFFEALSTVKCNFLPMVVPCESLGTIFFQCYGYGCPDLTLSKHLDSYMLTNEILNTVTE